MCCLVPCLARPWAATSHRDSVTNERSLKDLISVVKTQRIEIVIVPLFSWSLRQTVKWKCSGVFVLECVLLHSHQRWPCL